MEVLWKALLCIYFVQNDHFGTHFALESIDVALFSAFICNAFFRAFLLTQFSFYTLFQTLFFRELKASFSRHAFLECFFNTRLSFRFMFLCARSLSWLPLLDFFLLFSSFLFPFVIVWIRQCRRQNAAIEVFTAGQTCIEKFTQGKRATISKMNTRLWWIWGVALFIFLSRVNLSVHVDLEKIVACEVSLPRE